MTLLLELPVILKILISLSIILIIHSYIKNLHLSVLVGAYTLALWCGHSLDTIKNVTIQTFFSRNSLFLCLVILLVIILSNQMSEAGVLKKLLQLIKGRVSKRLSFAILPAVIGFLPMPGGALFSAPLVRDCDENSSVDPKIKVTANYWFRHIWEWWWPLYPGVILAIALSGLEVWEFILLHFPLCVVSALAGYFFILAGISNEKPKYEKRNRKFFFEFLGSIFPILVIIFVYTIVRTFFADILSFNKYLPMGIAVVFGAFSLQMQKPLNIQKWKKIFFNKKPYLFCLLVIIIHIYSGFIQIDLPNGESLIIQMKNELNQWNIPSILIIVLIPFLSGLCTGVAVGFVGMSFPIILSLLGSNPTEKELIQTILLAYGFGFLGMILSPLHICWVVSNEYFKTKIIKSFVVLLMPVIMLAFVIWLYYLIIGFLM